MILVEIIIPTYNRLELFKQTLESVLLQTVTESYNLTITISDNSTDNLTENYVSNFKNGNINYVRRNPSLSVLDHLSWILREVKGEYFMVFHDDDIMCIGMLSYLLDNICNTNSLAIASNAYILKNETRTNRPFFKDLHKPYQIENQFELLNPYLKRNGFVPFPGYLYRKAVSKIKLNYKYGKHIDVYLLSQILEQGSIIILDKPLYYYRIHVGQDSFKCDFIGKLNLIKFIVNKCNINFKDKTVIDCRLYNIYDEFRTRIMQKQHVELIKVYKFYLLSLLLKEPIVGNKLLLRFIKGILDK